MQVEIDRQVGERRVCKEVKGGITGKGGEKNEDEPLLVWARPDRESAPRKADWMETGMIMVKFGVMLSVVGLRCGEW